MATNTYKIEYATTGRAKCKDSKCKQTIEKGAMRIGKESPNPFSDDEADRMVSWYHAECMFNAMARMRAGTKKIESIDDIAGFDDLEDDDQEIVRALVEEAGKGGGGKKKGTKRKKAAAPKKAAKKKPAKKAAAPSGDADYVVYLVADSVSGGKFWEAKQFGSTTAVRYGKVGAKGSTSTKEHDDEDAARKFIDKTAKAKRKKGYEDAENEDEDDEEEEEEEKKPAKKKKVTKKKAAKKKPEPESDEDEDEDEDEDMDGGDDRVVYLVADSVSGGKFWECTVSGSTVTTRYGKIDSDGQTTVKSFKDNAAAIKFADKKEREKRKKGYEEE